MSTTRDALVRILVLAAVLVGLAGGAAGQDLGEALERGFKEPPDSAKPRVWWH